MSIFSFLTPKKTRASLVISAEIIKRAKKQNLIISNMCLQKLLFIANGLHLAKTGKPLLTEPIEVWQYGPVVNKVYYQFNRYGNSNIKTVPLKYKNKRFNDIEKEIIEFVIGVAGRVDVIQLSNWTHSHNSPWYIAKESKLKVIPNFVMENFFKQFLVNEK